MGQRVPLRRGISAELLPCLDLTVEDFTARQRPPGVNPRLVTVRPDADLGDVLAKMAFNHVHHVFLTDLEGRPIGLLTPTDVLHALVGRAVQLMNPAVTHRLKAPGL
jgi:CBS-domain-containing membrane protein